MKRKTKEGSGLYAYLTEIGVLGNGSDDEIKRHKNIYWARYRKEWKKNKRQESKRYIIFCSFKEARILNKKAEKLGVTPAKYIKQAALLNETLVGPAVVGLIRETLILNTQTIESKMEAQRIPDPERSELLNQLYLMEKELLLLLTPK